MSRQIPQIYGKIEWGGKYGTPDYFMRYQSTNQTVFEREQKVGLVSG
ncbi:MAG: hypothetical protein AB1567_10265 [bacterium]